MDNQASVLLNTPKSFGINGKKFQVKALSMIGISELRQTIAERIKANQKKDIGELVKALAPSEQTKFLLESRKALSVANSDIEEYLISINGIMLVVQNALGLKDEEIKPLFADSENHETLFAVYQHALGEVEESKEVPTVVPTEKK
jgi:hypothetical protein